MPGTMLVPMMRMNQPHVAISEPKAITQHPTRSRTNTTKHHSHHAPCVPCDVCRHVPRAAVLQLQSTATEHSSSPHHLVTTSSTRLIAPSPISSPHHLIASSPRHLVASPLVTSPLVNTAPLPAAHAAAPPHVATHPYRRAAARRMCRRPSISHPSPRRSSPHRRPPQHRS